MLWSRWMREKNRLLSNEPTSSGFALGLTWRKRGIRPWTGNFLKYQRKGEATIQDRFQDVLLISSRIVCSIENVNESSSRCLFISADKDSAIGSDHCSNIFWIVLIGRITNDCVRESHWDGLVGCEVLSDKLTGRFTDLPKIHTGRKEIDTNNIIWIKISHEGISCILNESDWWWTSRNQSNLLQQLDSRSTRKWNCSVHYSPHSWMGLDPDLVLSFDRLAKNKPSKTRRHGARKLKLTRYPSNLMSTFTSIGGLRW